MKTVKQITFSMLTNILISSRETTINIRNIILLGCITLIILIGISPATLRAEKLKEGEYGLFFSYYLCLLSKEEDLCTIDLHIHWQSKLSSNFCLIESTNETPIQCWTNTDSADLKISFNLKEDLTLFLLNTESNEIVYQNSVKLQRQVKFNRKKQRNPWRFY